MIAYVQSSRGDRSPALRLKLPQAPYIVCADSEGSDNVDMQAHLTLCYHLTRGLIQSNIHKILRKVNKVIYIMYPNHVPDIMILAQTFTGIQYFVHKVALPYKMPRSEKGHNSVKYFFPKVYQVI